jgi:hypothetical protein
MRELPLEFIRQQEMLVSALLLMKECLRSLLIIYRKQNNDLGFPSWPEFEEPFIPKIKNMMVLRLTPVNQIAQR